MHTWATPLLHVHGTVAEITTGGGGNSPDTGGGNSALVAVPSDRALKERVVLIEELVKSAVMPQSAVRLVFSKSPLYTMFVSMSVA